jgi:competence protein ComEC
VARQIKGCGCAAAVLVVVLGAAAVVGWKYVWPWWKTKPPPASGGELQVHVLDVGPVNGDSILIIAPGGKTVLVDAGDTGKGKAVIEALKRYNVQQLDYFIGTHPHPDHLGGADEVFKAVKVLNVIDNGQAPDVPESLVTPTKAGKPAEPSSGKKPVSNKPASKKLDKSSVITKFYDEYREAIAQTGAHYEKAQPSTKYDLGGGVRLTILGPSEPLFTRDQMKTGGNLPNANSVVARLDYGDFSMLLPGDAEEQTEHRMLTKDLNLKTRILKVAHHGSKYTTTQDFLDRVKPEVAIVSCGEWNRYGHPSQVVLDRLKSMNTKIYRTDLQGEITITTKGRENDYVIKTAKESKSDVWVGRLAQKDDSTRSGFIAYGDFGPPPKTKAGK